MSLPSSKRLTDLEKGERKLIATVILKRKDRTVHANRRVFDAYGAETEHRVNLASLRVSADARFRQETSPYIPSQITVIG